MVKGEQVEFSVPERLNLGSYYLDVNLEAGRGDKTALYYQDRSYSFLDLWRLTNRVGNVFKGLGVEPENRVLLILEDSPEWVAAWLAAMKVGAVGTHAYTYLKPHDYAYLLNLVKPKVVVVDKTTLERVREGAKSARYPKAFLVAGESTRDLKPGEFSLGEMIESADDRLEIEPTHRDDLAFWNFTGGTTGKPKGVPHMHRDSVLSYQSFNRILGYNTDDIVLLVPKLFFHYARDNGLLFALRSGAAVILFGERPTAALIFQFIRKFRPTAMLNVPTMMRAMIQTPKHERSDLSCLRRCLSSGEVLSPQLYDEWVSNFGTEVLDRFGSAESGMGYLCNRPGKVRPGSSGTVTPLAEIKLVDDEGLEVPRGQPGLLLTRSDAAAQYYVREHEKSKATFLGDEWIDTGDIFIQDEMDYFWHVGRADEMVKVSGVWVSPLEVERTLQECPRVRECAALGIKDRDGLTKIQAFVALRDGAEGTADMQDELKRFLRERLAPHKIPRSFDFLDELPKTGQGKIDRRVLRERRL
jgi:benzoate-CoA ligase family protein